MFRVAYASTVGMPMFAMECSNILHVVGVVSGHIAKPDKEHGNGYFGS
jgi:hypothetical protein